MAHFPQGFDLSQLNAFVPAAVLLLHFFYGHHFACLDVSGLVDCSKSSVAKGLDRFVFLHSA